MLLRLGMEPGPIDGVIGPQTTAGLAQIPAGYRPAADRSGQWRQNPGVTLVRLRNEASRVIFEGERKPGAAGAPPMPPAAALAPVQPAAQSPAPQPPDRFAACPFSAADFKHRHDAVHSRKISAGRLRWFDGARRFDAERPPKRGAADRREHRRFRAGEVQRQARVLDYFTLPAEDRTRIPEMKD